MQPTLPQSAGSPDMDLPAVQSMDWLFKKEQIFIMAQFWQQRAAMAEKEVNTLREQLSTTSSSSPHKALHGVTENGLEQSIGSPATIDSVNKLSSKLLNNKHTNDECIDEDDDENDPITTSAQIKLEQSILHQTDDLNDTEQNDDDDDNNMNSSNNRIDSNEENENNEDGVPTDKSSTTNKNINNNNILSNVNNNSCTMEEHTAKDKEISALVTEITRLQSALANLRESHCAQIQRLEEQLEVKRQHINRLEAKLEKDSLYENVSKLENSTLRPLGLPSPVDSKQFQELLLERTKALAAAVQTEAMKSSSSDDGHHNQQDDKISQHDVSSTASPSLQDSRMEENMNGGMTPLSLPTSKSPTEDNNNTLSSLQHHSNNFMAGLPFHQFQDRMHFKFGEDMPMPPGSMTGRLSDSLIPKSDPMEAKLQEMLRYNMDKYANQNLDTLHISRRVRELLSVHNIGQRLFAKYVLGLSQGTVSELLSKPKPWDKLTEKGRDSYRKMHAWGCDDNAILLLKSLIPKKDAESVVSRAYINRFDAGMPPYGRPDDINDDRIAHILSEASSLMKGPISHHQQQQQQLSHLHQQQTHLATLHNQHNSHKDNMEDSHSIEDSKSPHDPSLSPFTKEQMKKLKKYENDDISQDKVTRIYQEELAKLINRQPRDPFPSGMPPTPGGGLGQIPDDQIRTAFEAYQRELSKLQQGGAGFPNLPGLLALQQQALNGAQDLSVKKEVQAKLNGQQQSNIDSESTHDTNDDKLVNSSAFNLVRPKPEAGSTPSAVSTTASSLPSPLSNSILPPSMTPTDDFSSAASPLQRMASITNSLITQSPVTQHHNSPQRPLKAVLPPITQQQFDMFNNLNTEDIVRRVKEALSQYSISQRLFGESVLGLSQGSVSDLLARPKPWHMLTQKGREPFIRMKMFLEDENAVHKLVASQYKIAPEKLMRTGNYSGTPQLPMGMAKQISPMQKLKNDMPMLTPEQHQQIMQMHSPLQHIPPSQFQQHQHQQQQREAQHHRENQQQREVQQQLQQQQQSLMLTPPGIPQPFPLSLASSQEKKQIMPMPVHSPQQQANAMRGLHQHMSPTVYEMAALTQDLDTQIITTKIKEALLANNIGQKIFGEAVLGLSQGSVSELLSKPKPWHMLSIKGREPFIRMQLWLADANNVDRLQAIKNERREATKRRRSTVGAQDNSSDTSSNDTSEFYTSNSPGPCSIGSTGAPPNKKQRVLFSEEQKEALRIAFHLDPYPNVATIEFLASELGLSTRTITNWFHNHRMRLKQQIPHGAPADAVPSRENQTGAPFDPVQFRARLGKRLMELRTERMGLGSVPIQQYGAYLAANSNLAALIGRGLLPTSEEFANVLKDQMNCLDLSLKRDERDDDFEEMDGDCDDSHLSDSESLDGTSGGKSETKETPTSSLLHNVRSSRRKPAAPQWVNPDWQDDIKPGSLPIAALVAATSAAAADKEEIINGVCVMRKSGEYEHKDDDDDDENDDAAEVDDNVKAEHDEDAPFNDDEENASAEKENTSPVPRSKSPIDDNETDKNDDSERDGDEQTNGESNNIVIKKEARWDY